MPGKSFSISNSFFFLLLVNHFSRSNSFDCFVLFLTRGIHFRQRSSRSKSCKIIDCCCTNSSEDCEYCSHILCWWFLFQFLVHFFEFYFYLCVLSIYRTVNWRTCHFVGVMGELESFISKQQVRMKNFIDLISVQSLHFLTTFHSIVKWLLMLVSLLLFLWILFLDWRFRTLCF
jgi:hypothetical protein